MKMIRAILSLCVLASGALALPCAAATRNWSSNATNATWANGPNWVGGVAPVNDLTTDFASFDQTSYGPQPTATSGGNIAGLIFGNNLTSTAAVTLSTSNNLARLNIGSGGILVNSQSTAVTIGANSNQGLQVGASQAWTNNSGSLLSVASFSNQSPGQNFTLTLNGTGTGGFAITGAIRNEYDAGNTGTLSFVIDTPSSVSTSFSSANFTGTTTVTSGMLVYTRTAARGGGSAVSVAASGSIGLGVGGSGFFNATAVDQLFANTLSGITMNATSGVGIDTSAGNFTYATSQSATRSLTKLGANTLTLSGNNTYSGQTFVNAGTLAVTGSIVGSGVTVRNGGTLAGNGTISGSVTVNGGTISPGNSPGTLTIDGALSLESLSLLDFELNAGDQTVGGGINDLITLGSDLILDGTLDVTSSPLSTGTWRLFNYSGNLTDLGLTVGSISLAPSHSASIETSVLGQINLVVVPEPATIALLGSGVAMLGLRLVRRRQASARDRV